MLDTIKVMRQAANLLNEECDRVEHGVVKGGEVTENFVVVNLAWPAGLCYKCAIKGLCSQIDMPCEKTWKIFSDNIKNLASNKKQ